MAKKVYVGVPIKYKEVEYIESTGTQYIDTGIVPKSTTRMILDMAITDLTVNNRNGWGSSENQECFSCGIVSDNFYACVSNNWTVADISVAEDSNRHIFDISNTAIKLDGVTYGTGNIGNTATTGQTLYIFAMHTEYVNGSVYYEGAREKIYSCQIYDGDTLVRDFQPIKLETGEYCLLEKVENRIYHNLGTGNFTGIAGENTYNLTYSTAQKVKKIYIGDANRIAREVKKGYIGVSNIAREFYISEKSRYGDGSLNTVSLGYEGKLKINGETALFSNGSRYSGNCRIYGADISNNTSSFYKKVVSICQTTAFANIASGTNTIITNLTASDDLFIMCRIWCGSGTTSTYVNGLKFSANGTYYTLQEMVTLKIVKPLVLISSSASNGNYYFPTAVNVYSGGGSGTGNYAGLFIVFVLSKGNIINGCQFTTNKAWGSSDGVQYYYANEDDCELTLE